MGLETAALEHGDGEWENIQDVLRDAFLVHDRTLQYHNDRLDASERHSTELREQWTATSETLATLQGLRGHVDKLARVVNSLSEEMKQRAHADQERQQQHATWMASVTRSVELQIQTLRAQVAGDVEETCTKALASVERRMELMEEELGHLVTALDRKTDLDAFRTHKQAMEEALKQRCRKAAFDKEVVRVHQMIRAQHAAMHQRFESSQQDLQQQLDQYIQTHQPREPERESSEEAIAAAVQVQCQQMRQEIMDEITTERVKVEDIAARLVGREVATAQSIVSQHVAQLVSEKSDELQRMLQEHATGTTERLSLMENEWNKWQQRASAATEDINVKLAALQEERSVALVQMTDRLDQWQQDRKEDRDRVEKQFDTLKSDLVRLQSQVDGVADRSKQQQSDEEQQHATFRDELQDLARARDKKTRQQMHLVADKLREMDQILKLVGKQLVQNTSQLQLLWLDQQHESSGSLIGGDRDLRLLEGDALDTSPNPTTVDLAVVEPPHDEAKDEGDARRMSHHQQLQASIVAKLRDYEAVLSSGDTSTELT